MAKPEFSVSFTVLEKQEKLSYYLIGLNAAAISYSIYLTQGLGFEYLMISLLIACISWATSMYIGITFLLQSLSLQAKVAIELMDESPKENQNLSPVGYYLQRIKDQASDLEKKYSIQHLSEEMVKRFNWQWRLFLVGSVFFLLWHLLSMYFMT